MLTHLSKFKTYAIVIKDNNASEFYFKNVSPLWEQAGFNVQRYDAVSPATLPQEPLIFGRNESAKFARIGGKEVTESEKACFYSHYNLWNHCVNINEPIVILEHDCVPFNYDLLTCNLKRVAFQTYDQGALGCYIITPFFAKMTLDRIHYKDNYLIRGGPLGELQHFFCSRYPSAIHNPVLKKNIFMFNKSCHNYAPACTQIYHNDYENTIDHFSTMTNDQIEKIESYKNSTIWPDFINITNTSEPLTKEYIRNEVLKFDYGKLSFKVNPF